MYRKQLNKGFIKNHPLEEYSAYIISVIVIESDEFKKIASSIVMPEISDERKEEISADIARIKAADSAEEIVALFRKDLDVIAKTELISRAIEHEQEVFPLLFKRYCTSRQISFIEGAIQFFGRSKENYSNQLLEVYDSIRDPYAQAQACVVSGLRGPEEAIPKMFSEYKRFLLIDDEEDTYSQAPLLALHKMYNRFYAK